MSGHGYRDVDATGDVAASVGMMDATSRWPATIELRAWERERLALVAGERLLDVGCGPGDAALALAAQVAPGGEVVGVDRSTAMVEVARRRSSTVRFVVGDAMALDEPDASFDAVRSERTLQWVPDPGAAVTELARVLRPGERLVLIDSDSSTFRLDVGASTSVIPISRPRWPPPSPTSSAGRRTWAAASPTSSAPPA